MLLNVLQCRECPQNKALSGQSVSGAKEKPCNGGRGEVRLRRREGQAALSLVGTEVSSWDGGACDPSA